jgi:hypothetical protein
MSDWQAYKEPIRVALTRTLSIALVAGALSALLIGVELVAHAALHLRNRPSFYDGRA